MPTARDNAFVYIDELLDNKVPIYVRNVYKEQRGIVSVTFNDGHATHRETIPNTRYPICLSSKVTPAMIRSSRDLRQMLDRGVLALVDHKEAERELRKEGVREALDAAYDRISSSSSAVKNVRMPADKGNGKASIDIPDMNGPHPAVMTADADGDFSDSGEVGFRADEDEDEETKGVSIHVQSLVESLISGDMRSRQVKTDLMSLELESADLAFLISRTKGIVQRYAKECFSKLPDAGSSVDVL